MGFKGKYSVNIYFSVEVSTNRKYESKQYKTENVTNCKPNVVQEIIIAISIVRYLNLGIDSPCI